MDSSPQCRTHGWWADLMRRAFAVDGLACPQCGNRMRLLATIEEPEVVEQPLTHLGPPRAGAGGPDTAATRGRGRSFHGHAPRGGIRRRIVAARTRPETLRPLLSSS